MDRVKLGRALGYGARHAAKAVAQAVDAATTPTTRAEGDVREMAGPGASRAARPTVARVTQQAKTAGRVAGKSAWAPVARVSSVLWLQVTGAFFALLALALGQGLWSRRGLLRLGAGSHEAQKAYLAGAVVALFAYFAVSNFVRAAKREKR